jgi:virginiamycin B lyase
MKRILLLVAFGVAVAGVLALAAAVRADGPPLLTEYPVPGSPLYVSVEAPGRVWFTLPDQNAIGRLVVTSTTDYSVVTYTVPTTNSQPYDLKYAGGAVWFTELSGNKIGRLDPGSGAIAEFTIPTLGSQPAGIDVLPGNPTTVWFTERSGNKLGRLVVTSTMDYLFAEYPLPSGYPNAQPEDIHIQNTDSIWFTAPGANRIGNLKPDSWQPFELVYAGGGSRPWTIQAETHAGGTSVWFTEPNGNRIGQYFYSTMENILWYTLTYTASGPYDLALWQGKVWFTELSGNRVGWLVPSPRQFREFGLPAGSAPKGLGVDSNGCVWVAESGRNRIAAWCPPYFRFVYLPLVLRNAQ